MNWETVGKRSAVSAAFGLLVTLVSAIADANVYGVRYIWSDTVLKDHQFGSIIFGADDISLDCKGYQVHISSFTHLNCTQFGTPLLKCGIVATNKRNISIRNCNVVGGFASGVHISGTDGATLHNVTSNASTGFWFGYNSNLSATELFANGSSGTGALILEDLYGSYDINTENVGSFGISIQSSMGTYLDHVRAYQSGSHGLSVSDSTYVTISGGLFHANRGHGILIERSSSVSSSYSFALQNGRDTVQDKGWGIHLVGVSYSSFLNGTFQSNAQPCDAFSDDGSFGNDWSGSTIGRRCFFVHH